MELCVGAHVTGVSVKPSRHNFSYPEGLWDPPTWTNGVLYGLEPVPSPPWVDWLLDCLVQDPCAVGVGLVQWIHSGPSKQIFWHNSGLSLQDSKEMRESPFRDLWEPAIWMNKTLGKVQKILPQGTMETVWALKWQRFGLKPYFSSPWSCILCQVIINLLKFCIIIFKMETFYNQYNSYPVACQVSWSVPDK